MFKRAWIPFGLALLLLPIFVLAQQPVEADFTGSISDEAPFAEFPLRVAVTGSTVIIDMAPIEAKSSLDTNLLLVDENNTIVAQNDDRIVNQDTSSLIVFPEAAAGNYRIIATRFGIEEGASSGDFRILVDIQQAAEPPAFETREGDLLNTGFPIDLEAKPQATWTVLAYYGGDNNLEESVLRDLKEFEVGGGSSEDVNIVALVDRSPEYSLVADDWQTTRIYEVASAVNPYPEQGEALILDSTLIAEIPNLDSGDGQIFAQFLVWAMQKYPAENYVVAFASHGAGWQGIIQDDSAGEGDASSLLSLADLAQALSLAQQASGVERFAFLINDACLMSSVEYYSAVSPYFQYSAASPEIVVDPALDMRIFTQTLLEQGAETDFIGLGEALVSQYIEEDVPKRGTKDIVYLSHSLADMTQFNAVTTAVENLAAVINERSFERGQDLALARSNTYTYTAFLGENTKVDLYDLVDRLIGVTNDDALIEAAEGVRAALDQTLVFGEAVRRVQAAAQGQTIANTPAYFNIYFPEKVQDFDANYFAATPLKEWSRMLRNFYNVFSPPWVGSSKSLQFHPPAAPKVTIVGAPTEAVNVLNPALIGLEYTGRDIVSGRMNVDRVFADGSKVRVWVDPILVEEIDADGQLVRVNRWEDGVVRYDVLWRVEIPYVTDGFNSESEFLSQAGDIVFLDGRYREVGSETWNEVSIAFDIETGTAQRIINRNPQSDALAVIDIPVGSEFQTRRLQITPDGKEIAAFSNIYIWPRGGLTWRYRPAPNGEYEIGLALTAFGGPTGSSTVRINVNNDGKPEELRAYAQPFEGFILPYELAWQSVAYNDEPPAYRSISKDGGDNVTVYLDFAFDPALTPNELAQNLATTLGFTIVGDITPNEVSGIPVVEFSYTYTNADGQAIEGRAFYRSYTDIFTGYLFAAETSAGQNELLRIYTELTEGVSLFDANAFLAQRTYQWSSRQRADEMRFRIPTTWTLLSPEPAEGVSPLLDWRRFAPADATDPYAFVALRALNVQSEIVGVDGILSALAAGQALDGVQNATITNYQVYSNRTLEWEALLYTAQVGETSIVGRVYVTQLNGKLYAVWAEATEGDSALDIFQNVVEPIIDGMIINQLS